MRPVRMGGALLAAALSFCLPASAYEAPEGFKRLLQSLEAPAFDGPQEAAEPAPQDRAQRLAEALHVLGPKYLEDLHRENGFKGLPVNWRLAELAAPARAGALRALAELGAKEQAALIAGYLRARDDGLRYEALAALKRLGLLGPAGPVREAELVALVEDKDGRVALLALRELKAYVPARKHAFLAGAILSEGYGHGPVLGFMQMTRSGLVPRSTDFMTAVMGLLAESPGAHEAMSVSRWITHSAPGVRLAALEVMARSGSRNWSVKAALLLGDDVPEVAERARLCLKACGVSRQEQVDVLRRAMKEEVLFQHRLQAVKALDRLGAYGPSVQELDQFRSQREERLRRAAMYLVKKSSADGSWPVGEVLRIRTDASVAVAALGAQALAAALDPARGAGKLLSPAEAEEIRAAIAKARAYLKAQSADASEQGWCGVKPFRLAYALSAAARSDMDPSDRKAAVDKALSQLYRDQKPDGGFGYGGPGETARSFTTAAVMIGLLDAYEAGYGTGLLPVLKRAADSLQKSRINAQDGGGGVFTYGSDVPAASKVNTPTAAAGRTVLAELALYRLKKALGEPAETRALDRALEVYRGARRVVGLVARASLMKSYPHEGPDKISDYFYFFGELYAAQALKLSGLADKAAVADEMTASLLWQQEADGSWTDSKYGGPASGTAMVILILTSLP